MDPALTTLVLSSVNTAASAASQEAGKHVWQVLGALVRRARRQPDAVVEPGDAPAVAATLVAAAEGDPGFAAELRSWLELVERLADRIGAVTNTIGDGARITGNVVQARDITGPITFH